CRVRSAGRLSAAVHLSIAGHINARGMGRPAVAAGRTGGPTMKASLQTLLTRLIDYAGLFPPAQLSLADAVHNHPRQRNDPEGWMLGRFVMPAARLGELAEFHADIPAGQPIACAALGRGGNDEESFLAGLGADLADIVACRQGQASVVAVDVL